jgi:hypothetical protein
LRCQADPSKGGQRQKACTKLVQAYKLEIAKINFSSDRVPKHNPCCHDANDLLNSDPGAFLVPTNSLPCNHTGHHLHAIPR